MTFCFVGRPPTNRTSLVRAHTILEDISGWGEAHNRFPANAFSLEKKTRGKSSGLAGKPNPNQRLSTCLCIFNIPCASILAALHTLPFSSRSCAAFLCCISKPCFLFPCPEPSVTDFFGGITQFGNFLKIMKVLNTSKSGLFCFRFVCVFVY